MSVEVFPGSAAGRNNPELFFTLRESHQLQPHQLLLLQSRRLDPGSPSLVKAHDHVIGYNPFLPTLIKSSGAKNCRVSIPVCNPTTNAYCQSHAMVHSPGNTSNEPPPIRVSPFPLWVSSVCPSPTNRTESPS